MERKQGFFKAFKDDVASGLSPARYRRARSQSPLPSPLRRSRASSVDPADRQTKGSGLSGPGFEALSPFKGAVAEKREAGQSPLPAPSLSMVGPDYFRSDQRLLLGIFGAPLGPVHVSNNAPSTPLVIKDNRIVRPSSPRGEENEKVNAMLNSATAKYILHQYIAASGSQKMQSKVENVYASGSVKMLTSCIETDTKVLKSTNSANEAESGSFELWQMNPDMWYVELALGDSKVQAGCNGSLVWRKTPWLLGTHTVKGPGRPLRRALQGLDPRTMARMFAGVSHSSEKNINGEACFTLGVEADSQTLEATSEKPTKVIEHTLVGYFSQRTGLLVGLKDSHMKLIRTEEGESVRWKTTIVSLLDDYRPVEGIMIAHSGRSEATLERFAGEPMRCTATTRMEETWTIQEVAFNVSGLSGRGGAALW